MEIRELRSMLLLAETGSITRTAETLHLTPAAVHKQLKSLERELEVHLYERQAGRLILTQAAETVLPHAKELLAQYDAAMTALDEWKGMKTGLVRIGSGPSLSSHVLPKMLKRFRDAHPDIDLLVETGSSQWLIERLERGALDLALMISAEQEADARLQVECAWRYEVLLVSNLPEAPRRCSLRDLEPFPFILFQKGGRIEAVIDRYLTEHSLRPRVAMRFDNAEAIRAMIHTGLGISMLPTWTVEHAVEAGDLHVIRQKEKRLHTTVALVSPRDRYVPRPVAAFVEAARSAPKTTTGARVQRGTGS